MGHVTAKSALRSLALGALPSGLVALLVAFTPAAEAHVHGSGPAAGRTSYFTEAFQDIYRSSSGVTYCQQALAQWEHGPGNPTNGNGRWTARAYSKSYTSGSCQFNGTGSSQPPYEITSRLRLYISSTYKGPVDGVCYTRAQSNASTATLVTTFYQADTPGQPCGYGYYYVQAESRVSWSIGDRYVYAENSETHHMPS